MNNDIGKRILEIRELLELSQEAFGKEIGMTKSAISKIEKGENSLTEKNLKLISQRFGINEEWIRTGEGEIKKNEHDFIQAIAESFGNIDEKDMEIVKMYLSLDKKYRTAFKTFLEGFKKKYKKM